jgi:hypothetical protein
MTSSVSLKHHPESRGDAVHSIDARVARARGGALIAAYTIKGDLARLRIPPLRPPRFAERLWQHCCCEIFIARKGMPAYHEFNFSPSGEWAAYAFARYREPGLLTSRPPEPQIAVRRSDDTLELEAQVRHDPGGKLSIGLSVVVEDIEGAFSYWALRHPPGKPDFHHRDAFALELDEVRN